MKTFDKWSSNAKKKAFLVSSGFILWAIFSIFVLNIKPTFLAMFVFYILLVINTFFSVRIFATITPEDHLGQKFWDFLLFICLVAIPLSFKSPVYFVAINTLLFIIATLKYIYMVPLVGFSKLLFKKIRVDTLGSLLCIVVLIGVLTGYARLSLNIWAAAFFIANIYVLWHKPLYRLEHHIAS